MAHKYSSFGTAFYNLQIHWVTGRENFNSAVSEHTAAYNHYMVGEDHEALGHLINVTYFDTYALRCLAQYDEAASDQSELMESLYWSYWGIPTYTLTMLKIIDAMASSNVDELETFICMLDAFRASIWDRPFNQAWYAGMVRKFKTWL